MNIQARMKAFGFLAGLVTTVGSANAAVTILSETWEYTKTSTDINVDSTLHSSVGYGLNQDNPTTLNGAGSGGNVLLDQGGFGGTYGVGTNAGSAIRIRSSNGAWLNRNALALSAYTSVTFSFDLKQNTANYHQVVEYSSDQAFTSPVLLDTFTGDTDLGVWLSKSYTITTGLTDTAYFRIRKLRPSPVGTTGGANGTSHTYDNILITAVPEPSSSALLGLAGLALIMRRRK
ncbi:PEP-CTERM sorting domain-containing protein [Akkermansiaceae bacterium]|nr:PEP-CTERM sorting domain-containing protein [Akkermansiaceae bacterium]